MEQAEIISEIVTIISNMQNEVINYALCSAGKPAPGAAKTPEELRSRSTPSMERVRELLKQLNTE